MPTHKEKAKTEEELQYYEAIEAFKRDWPQQSPDEDKDLAVRIYEINGWADLRHQNRGIGVVDHNRYETDRMSQILEACRKSESPWGEVILSALPYGCIKETDELAALLAKQRAEPRAEAATDDKPEPTTGEGTEITCPACSQKAHLALRRGDPCGGIGTCAFCGTEQGADGYFIGVIERDDGYSGFVCQSCARKEAPNEYLRFVKAQMDRYMEMLLAAMDEKELPF